MIELANQKGCPTSMFKAMENNSLVGLFICTLVQKWLRDEHMIHISVTVFPDNRWGWIHYYLNKIDKMKGFELYEKDRNTSAANNYEEALLNGLHEALKLI